MKRQLNLALIIVVLLLVGFLAGRVSADSIIHIVVNGNEITSDVPPQIINGRTMVPISAVAQALGCHVNWDGSSDTVNIQSGNSSPSASSYIQYAQTQLLSIASLAAQGGSIDPNNTSASYATLQANDTEMNQICTSLMSTPYPTSCFKIYYDINQYAYSYKLMNFLYLTAANYVIKGDIIDGPDVSNAAAKLLPICEIEQKFVNQDIIASFTGE
jgi:hypothetical protein